MTMDRVEGIRKSIEKQRMLRWANAMLPIEDANHLLSEISRLQKEVGEKEKEELTEWPCQQLYGGTGEAIYHNVDGKCKHPECHPKNDQRQLESALSDCQRRCRELQQEVENHATNLLTTVTRAEKAEAEVEKKCEDCKEDCVLRDDALCKQIADLTARVGELEGKLHPAEKECKTLRGTVKTLQLACAAHLKVQKELYAQKETAEADNEKLREKLNSYLTMWQAIKKAVEKT